MRVMSTLWMLSSALHRRDGSGHGLPNFCHESFIWDWVGGIYALITQGCAPKKNGAIIDRPQVHREVLAPVKG